MKAMEIVKSGIFEDPESHGDECSVQYDRQSSTAVQYDIAFDEGDN